MTNTPCNRTSAFGCHSYRKCARWSTLLVAILFLPAVGFRARKITRVIVEGCAPQCEDPSDDGCNRLSTVEPGSPECLVLYRATPYIQAVQASVLGLPIAGACDRGSKGGCSGANPYDPILRHWGLDWPPSGYAMMGEVRLINFRSAIDNVNRAAIPGAIVELGVWRGGGMILAAAVNKESRSKRAIILFDAFESIKNYGPFGEFLSVREQDVREGFNAFNLLDEHVQFRTGLFAETLPEFYVSKSVQSIAVLRVDGNFYDSYQDAMYYMYDFVSIGGIIIFDDVMSHPPVKQFWKDFKLEQGLKEELVRIDFHSAWFRKTHPVKIDWSFFRAPQDANAESRHEPGCPALVSRLSQGKCHASWYAPPPPAPPPPPPAIPTEVDMDVTKTTGDFQLGG